MTPALGATAGTRQVVAGPVAGFPEWYPSSAAVRSGPFVFTASIGAADWIDGLAVGARLPQGLPHSSGHPVKTQVREIYRRLQTVLAAAGADLSGGVSINQWIPTYHGEVERHPTLRDPYALFWEQWRTVAHAYIEGRDEWLLSDRPASCMMPIDRVLSAQSLVEVELVAVTTSSGITKRAQANDVHSPLGGYSVGMDAGPLFFSAGFIATDFATGLHPNARVPDHIWYGNQVAAETAEILRQIRITVEDSGHRWDDVAKVVVYLTPHGIANLPAVDEVFAREWPDSPPARAIVPVSGIGGVKHGNVEIFMTVATAASDREVVHSPGALAPLGHEAQAVRSGQLLFLSTQLGRVSDGPAPAATAYRASYPHTARHVVEQVRRLTDNAQALCEAAGTTLDNAVRADLYMTDVAGFPTLAANWCAAFSDGLPAAGFFEVPPGSLPVPGCDLAADIVVHVPG